MTEKQQQRPQENYVETSPQSAELFHLIVENIKDYAIFMTDPTGIVVSWNPGVKRLLGYTESEIVGQPISIIFSPEDRAAGVHTKEMEAAAAQGRSEDKRWHQRKDGSRFWANGMVMLLKNADGSFRGFAKVMRDDTAQKLAEEKIEQANSYTENILSSISDAFYTFDRDLRYVYVNKATTEMFSISESEFLGKPLDDLFPDVEGNVFHREVRQALAEGKPRVFENYYQPIDRWFENRIYPSPDGLSVFTSEITERKRAEEAFARLTLESEQQRRLYATILSNTPDLVYVFGLDHRFTYANDALLAMWGKTQEEAIGKNCLELGYEPWHAAMHDREIEQVKATKKPIRGEVPFTGTNGTRIYDYIFVPVIGASGEVEAVAGTTRDVTDGKQTEEALRESEGQLRTLADSIPQLAWMAQPDGFIFWYNRRWYEYTGTTPEQMEGWGWQSIHDAEILPEVVERWQQSLSTGEPFEMEFPLKGEDGAFRWFLTRVNPLRDSHGDITLWFGTNTDIEELRQARLSAEQANRLKDEFLATLSHELRTPLNAILGWSQVLQNRNLDEENARKALTTIERSARAQNQLIEDILDVSRIITGKLRLDVRAVDLPSVIGAAVDAARPAAEAKNIRLQTLLDPQAGPISGDPDRLQQVVWNLLSNAIKFTGKNGRVQVRLERINSHVEITVSDTGKGIEPEFLPHVFDRFRQSDGSMSRRHGGLGLGLAIVRQLVELHGGTVSVDSAGEDKGATFTVNLPLLPVRREPVSDIPRVHPQAATGALADCPPELNELHVLLVDDEADSRELLNLVLDSCGAEVKTASSAAEALAIIEREKFDVIISDIGMPEEDGFSLIGKIRNLPNEKGGDVPAIALTAYARAEDRVQALRAGFQMHIAKPVEPVELVAVVANLAGRMRKPNRNENE